MPAMPRPFAHARSKTQGNAAKSSQPGKTGYFAARRKHRNLKCLRIDYGRLAVDQPADAAMQGGHLSFQTDDLIRVAGFVAGLEEAAAIFVGHATPVLQETFHLSPHRFFQVITAYRRVIAHGMAAEAVASAPIQRW